MYKLGFEEAEEPEIKLPTSSGSEKAREFQKNIYFCFTDYTKAFVWIKTNCGKFFFFFWKFLKEMGVPDHLTCLLRNVYAGQEATVRTGHRTMDWFKIGKSYILSACLLNLYTKYITQNAGLDESQTRIKTARRNINSLRHADDTTLMAESEEKLKSFLTSMQEKSKKAGLKLNI